MVQTVLGTMSNWHDLQHIDSCVTFHAALDGEVPVALQKGIPEFVETVVVPAGFTARKGQVQGTCSRIL
jgi:hypothetical protein